MAKKYARVAGALLTVLGLAGMLGVGTTNPMTDFFHAFLGLLLAYAGFGGGGERFARGMVGGLGAICSPASLLGLAAYAAFGAVAPGRGEALVFSVGSAVGAFCLAAWWLSRRDERAKAR